MNQCDISGPDTNQSQYSLKKVPTGIAGIDEITNGGLPAGRPTLVCGGAGCGKSLLAMEFLVRGAGRFNEPGVFVSFEEKPQDLLTNYSSLRFDLPSLFDTGKLQFLHFPVNPNDFQDETGPFDLEGLFVRLGQVLRKSGAKRIALDTIETLFGGIRNHAILRSEILRLFNWLKDQGITAVITGERGDSQLTRQGLEEYVSDCVLLMDHRVSDQVSTRRLRIVKYRGSLHGTNEYPFLIDECGISLFPVTSTKLDHEASTERVSTGVPKLDEMLGGGYYRGSTVLISGIAGAGKTSLTAQFISNVVNNGEKTLLFAFEESPKQLIRNMRSIGIDLQSALDSGLLKIEATRASFYGLELHLLKIHRLVQEFKPKNVVIDPFTNFTSIGSSLEIQLMLTRLIDFLKMNIITTVLTSLTSPGPPLETSEVGVSAWIDTWLLLKEIESSGERNRGLYVLKSRGMAHSNQIREFIITSHGIDLVDVYLGPSGLLTGSARLAQEAREVAREVERKQTHEREVLELEQKEKTLKAKKAIIDAEMKTVQNQRQQAAEDFTLLGEQQIKDRAQMATSRKVKDFTELSNSIKRKAG